MKHNLLNWDLQDLQEGVDQVWTQYRFPIHEMWAGPETYAHILSLFGAQTPPEQRRLATCRVGDISATAIGIPNVGLVWLESPGWGSPGHMVRPWRMWLYSPVHRLIVRYKKQTDDRDMQWRVPLIGEVA